MKNLLAFISIIFLVSFSQCKEPKTLDTNTVIVSDTISVDSIRIDTIEIKLDSVK